MKPYTTTGENNRFGDLRRNWRMNANYRRQSADRCNKKSFRQRLKNEIKKELANVAL